MMEIIQLSGSKIHDGKIIKKNYISTAGVGDLN